MKIKPENYSSIPVGKTILRILFSLCALALGASFSFGQTQPLCSIDPGLLNRVELVSAKADVVNTPNGKALKVIFKQGAQYPHVMFSPAKAGFSQDWSAFRCLGVTVENPGSELVHLSIRIDSAGTAAAGRQGGADLLPGERKRLVFPLGGEPIIGMRGQPPVAAAKPEDVALNPSAVALELTKVVHFQLFLHKPEKDRTLLVHRLELFGDGKKGRTAFVDQFGQFNGADWPGKIHGEADFAAQMAAEKKDLAQHPSLSGRDRWGGWADGPTLKATGHFYAAKHLGKWWLVDPDGKLFWSSGITCVNYLHDTRVKGREQLFTWLPGQDDPLRKFASGAGKSNGNMNFFGANLYRKYGPEYKERFFDLAVRRFASWGINTAGNWGDYEEIAQRKGLAYTMAVPVRSKVFLAEEHQKAGLAKKKYFPDVFDPEFAKEVEAGLMKSAVPHKDDPWLMGLFVDNELHWISGDSFKNPTGVVRLSAIAFANDGSFAIKQALVKALQGKFKTIADLNKALGTSFRQWDEMLPAVNFTKAQLQTGAAVFAELDGLIADQYFRTVSQAIKRLVPGVPYLGCRFASYSEEVVRVAAKYCDVVSFNIYAYLPEERQADELAAKYDFPVVIGEFHFGALDRGMFDPGLRLAANQADRAAKYSTYIEHAVRGGWCVGAHWFQYGDQPLTGRGDGENYNIGFISGTDTPYAEMVEASRKINGALYRLRTEK